MIETPLSRLRFAARAAGFVGALLTACMPAQAFAAVPGADPTPPGTAQSMPVVPAASPASPGPDAIAQLAWLRGCWNGTVNQREFSEQWLPLAGGMMVGAGHTVMKDRTQDYQHLRLEARGDGVYYVATPSGEKESSFRLVSVARDERNPAELFTFANVSEGFPARIVYRHGAEGWLYAQIEGMINGEDKKVVYPMRHVDCGSGEMLHK